MGHPYRAFTASFFTRLTAPCRLSGLLCRFRIVLSKLGDGRPSFGAPTASSLLLFFWHWLLQQLVTCFSTVLARCHPSAAHWYHKPHVHLSLRPFSSRNSFEQASSQSNTLSVLLDVSWSLNPTDRHGYFSVDAVQHASTHDNVLSRPNACSHSVLRCSDQD